MKKWSFLLATMAIGMCSYAQRLPVPAAKNVVIGIRPNKKPVNLEKTDLQTSYSSNKMLGKASYSLVAHGTQSAIIRSGNVADTFIVQLEAGADPEKAVELFKLEVEKEERILPLGNKMLGKNQTADQEKPTIVFTKLADDLYAVSPQTQLETGEYCFIVNMPRLNMSAASGKTKTVTGYCFSVGN